MSSHQCTAWVYEIQVCVYYITYGGIFRFNLPSTFSEPDGVSDDDDTDTDTKFVIRSDQNSNTENDNGDKPCILNPCTVL